MFQSSSKKHSMYLEPRSLLCITSAALLASLAEANIASACPLGRPVLGRSRLDQRGALSLVHILEILCSHWRNLTMLATGLCHNNILKACKMQFVPFSVLLWLPCTERIYYRHPYAIKTQRKARNDPKPLVVGGFECLELWLYGIRELASARCCESQHWSPALWGHFTTLHWSLTCPWWWGRHQAQRPHWATQQSLSPWLCRAVLSAGQCSPGSVSPSSPSHHPALSPWLSPHPEGFPRKPRRT